LYFLDIVGLIEHFLIQIFEIFSIDISKSKFISCDISYITIRQEGFGSSWSKDTGIVSNKIRIVRIDNFKIFNTSTINGNKSKWSKKSTIWSLFIGILKNNNVVGRCILSQESKEFFFVRPEIRQNTHQRIITGKTKFFKIIFILFDIIPTKFYLCTFGFEQIFTIHISLNHLIKRDKKLRKILIDRSEIECNLS